jgi:SAM-dependent methyltransferase
MGVIYGLHLPWNPIKKQNVNWSINILGIGDDVNLSIALSQKYSYTNTHFDKFPKLDIRTPPVDLIDFCDVVICSDVLEHVDKNVELAIKGIYKILKPGGFAIISVPINTGIDKNLEYFPDLDTWEVSGNYIKWINTMGETNVDKSPEWHGGRGQTLAFRQWSAKELVDDLTMAGFHDIENVPYYPKLKVKYLKDSGIYIARKPIEKSLEY